jgi:antitoxin ParD1/3/4
VGKYPQSQRDVGDSEMKLVTLHVPETYIDGLEKLVESNLYPNRSEAIRIAIRDLLKRELWG